MDWKNETDIGKLLAYSLELRGKRDLSDSHEDIPGVSEWNFLDKELKDVQARIISLVPNGVYFSYGGTLVRWNEELQNNVRWEPPAKHVLYEPNLPKFSESPAITTFSTGAVRSSDCANERWDLISPVGLRRVAETCAEGAKKYSDFNWEKGMPVSEMLNHGIRHIYLYASGDRSEDHLAHAAWNLLGAMHSEELWPHLNQNLRGPGCVPPSMTSAAPQYKVGQDIVLSKGPNAGSKFVVTGVFPEGVSAKYDDGTTFQFEFDEIAPATGKFTTGETT